MDTALLACNQDSATFGQHQHQSNSKSAPILRSPTPSQTHSRTNPHTPTSSPHPTKPTFTYHNHNQTQTQPTCGILRSPKPVKPTMAKSHSESCFFSPSRLLSLPPRFSCQTDSSDPDQSLTAQPSPSLFANPPSTSTSTFTSTLPLPMSPFNHSSTGISSLSSPLPSTNPLASHEDLCAGEEVCSIFTRPLITQSLVSPSPRSRMPNSNSNSNINSSNSNNVLFHSPMPASTSTAIRRIDFGTPSIPSSSADSSSSTTAASSSFHLASPVKKAHAAKQHLSKLKIASTDSCLGYEYESSSSPMSESAAGLSPGQFVSVPENERPVDFERERDRNQHQALHGYHYDAATDGDDHHHHHQHQHQQQRYMGDDHDEVQSKLLSCSPPCRDMHPLLFESRIRVSSPFSHTFLSWSPAPEEENQLCRPVRAFSSSSFAMGVGPSALHFD